MAENGATILEIMLAGSWKSERLLVLTSRNRFGLTGKVMKTKTEIKHK